MIDIIIIAVAIVIIILIIIYVIYRTQNEINTVTSQINTVQESDLQNTKKIPKK